MTPLDVLKDSKTAPVYCDYIQHLVHKALQAFSNPFENDGPCVFKNIKLQYDLHPTGYMQSTKKFIECEDQNATRYKITIEEIR